jgi:lipoate-protein ligase A
VDLIMPGLDLASGYNASIMEEINPNQWRVIYSGSHRGPQNMAVDEALLESVGAGRSLPTLRLYGWVPGCLSLGYAQPLTDIDRLALEAQGWDLVRRPTGGKAILHADELTYAIVAPANHPALRGGVLESYRRLSQGLIAGVQRLGLVVDPPIGGMPSAGAPKNPICFEAPSAYEITSGGKKLLGSAQLRRKDGILQHGSLPLFGDLSRICLTLRYEDPQARRKARKQLLERATTVEAMLKQEIESTYAAQSLQSGFEDALGWTFIPGPLTEAEITRANELEDERYADPAWTGRV